VIAFRFLRSRILAAGLGLALSGALVAAPPTKTPSSKKAAAKKKKDTKPLKPRDYSKTLAILHTPQGDITLKFFYDKAPNHVKNFIDLAASGFYDGTLFHRVLPGFMIQGGDPVTKEKGTNPNYYGSGGNKDAQGNPVNVKAEFNDVSHRRGVLSMARATDPDSASSQFFIVVKDSPFLDRQYTAFGEVTKGIDIADKLVAESNYDPSSGPRGLPRNYQALQKVELVDETTTK
jgi:peptidyl-prolyl cis-trans isomerase B (cyclophilin B)